MQTSIPQLNELQQQLREIKKKNNDKKVFIGFDGFVDKIKKAVKQKRIASILFFETMKEFSNRILAASGKSGQIEMITQKIKLGGNAPIMANTLAGMGIPSSCLGSLGLPKLHPVFLGLDPKVKVLSALEPGLSDAVEFADGKIIFSELQVFDEYNWQHIKKTIGIDIIRKAVDESSLLAFVDWANLPNATDIWRGMLHDVIISSGKRDFIFLFDLCDPSKKTVGQINEVLDLISCFSPHGQVILGLNENETLKVWAALNENDSNHSATKEIPSVMKAGEFIYKAMNIDSLLVHPIDRAILFQKQSTLEMSGRLVTKPKVQTGGGDNLNAGFCLGLLNRLSMSQSLILGMAASGAYIENGESADIGDLISYLDTWMKDLKVSSATTNDYSTVQNEN